MANGNGDWLTKRQVLIWLISLAVVIISANWGFDLWEYCEANEARTKICDNHKHDLDKLGNQIEKVARESTEEVKKIRSEIREDFRIQQEHQREDMKELKRLIRNKNGGK